MLKRFRLAYCLALPLCVYAFFWAGSNVEASSREVLTVYTHDDFISPWGIGRGVKTAFEKQCDCEIEWVSFENPRALLAAITKEGKRSSADLVLGLDSALMALARHRNVFDTHGLNFKGLDLPGGWRDATFVPYSFAYVSLLYSKRWVRLPPESLDIFTRVGENVRIVLQNPRTSAGGMAFLLWTQMVFGDRAVDFWANIAPRVVSVEPNLDLALARLNKGQADFVVGYSTTPMYFGSVTTKDDIAALNINDGHYMVIDVAAIPKSSKRKTLARRFLQFMTSESFQDFVPTGGWVYPVDLGVTSLPSAMLRLPVPRRAFLMNEQQIRENEASWLKAWDGIFANKTVTSEAWNRAYAKAHADIKAKQKLLQDQNTSGTKITQ